MKQRQDTLSLQEAVLKQTVDELNNQLRDLKISHNLETQYNKSCKHVKVVGLPYQQGEEGYTVDANNKRIPSTSSNNVRSLEIITELVSKAGITGFHPNQVDVCHRTGDYYFSPIIVRFVKKQDKDNFFRQRYRLRQMEQLDLTMDSAKLKEWRQSKKSKQPSFDWGDAFPRIVMHEQLTELNSKILTAAKSLDLQKDYKFCWLHKGTIHVKKTETSKAIPIYNMDEIEVKIK